MKKIFLKNHPQNVVEKLVAEIFEKLKSNISPDQ